MDYNEVVEGRRSIRGFQDKPVPQDVLEEVVQLALCTPTSMNTQPYHFHIIAGEPLERIREENTRLNVEGVAPSREIRGHGRYEGEHRDRQIKVAAQLFEAMDIPWDDKEKRMDWVLRGFRQFDAPVAVVVTFDKVLEGGDYGPFDCGAVVNALVNAAWSKGLGTVINSQGIMQSPVVREHGNIPENEVIMICVALGYPEDDFAANDVRSTRRSVGEAASFVGF